MTNLRILLLATTALTATPFATSASHAQTAPIVVAQAKEEGGPPGAKKEAPPKGAPPPAAAPRAPAPPPPPAAAPATSGSPAAAPAAAPPPRQAPPPPPPAAAPPPRPAPPPPPPAAAPKAPPPPPPAAAPRAPATPPPPPAAAPSRPTPPPPAAAPAAPKQPAAPTTPPPSSQKATPSPVPPPPARPAPGSRRRLPPRRLRQRRHGRPSTWRKHDGATAASRCTDDASECGRSDNRADHAAGTTRRAAAGCAGRSCCTDNEPLAERCCTHRSARRRPHGTNRRSGRAQRHAACRPGTKRTADRRAGLPPGASGHRTAASSAAAGSRNQSHCPGYATVRTDSSGRLPRPAPREPAGRPHHHHRARPDHHSRSRRTAICPSQRDEPLPLRRA